MEPRPRLWAAASRISMRTYPSPRKASQLLKFHPKVAAKSDGVKPSQEGALLLQYGSRSEHHLQQVAPNSVLRHGRQLKKVRPHTEVTHIAIFLNARQAKQVGRHPLLKPKCIGGPLLRGSGV